MDNCPESFHSNDEKRFYQFAHSIFSYKSRKWLDKEIFKNRILKIKPNFKEENIEIFFNRILILNEYNSSWQLQSVTTDELEEGFLQKQVINNKIESVKISEEEFLNNSLSKKEFINRLNK